MELQGDSVLVEGKCRIHYVLPQPIDLNSASLEQLMLLRGIGVNYAKRIIARRPYRSIAGLATKARLPNYVVERIRNQITLGQSPHEGSRRRRHDASIDRRPGGPGCVVCGGAEGRNSVIA